MRATAHQSPNRHRARVQSIRKAAEALGLGWGGVEGNVVTLYFGDGAHRIRKLSNAECWLNFWTWARNQGSMRWYWWNFAKANYPRKHWYEVYHRLLADEQLL